MRRSVGLCWLVWGYFVLNILDVWWFDPAADNRPLPATRSEVLQAQSVAAVGRVRFGLLDLDVAAPPPLPRAPTRRVGGCRGGAVPDVTVGGGHAEPSDLVSQLHNAQDLTLSRLQKYLEPLGATLRIHAVFDKGGKEYSIPIRVGRQAS